MSNQETVQNEQEEVVLEQPQEHTDEHHEVGKLIQESKKYRSRAQEAEIKAKELENKLKSIEETKLKDQEQWKELAEKYEDENKQLSAMAEEGQKLQESIRQDLLGQLTEEDREFADDLSTDKLRKFVNRSSVKKNVVTNESAPGQMPATGKNPFTEMTAAERKKKCSSILDRYSS